MIDKNALMALAAYKKVYDCTPQMIKFVSTHIVWKKSHKTPCHRSFIIEFFRLIPSDLFPKGCDLRSFKMFFEHFLTSSYPINTLRNIARHGAKTRWHLISDLENVFSDNTSKILNQVVANYSDNVAIAINNFKVDDKMLIPINVEMLTNLSQTGK